MGINIKKPTLQLLRGYAQISSNFAPDFVAQTSAVFCGHYDAAWSISRAIKVTEVMDIPTLVSEIYSFLHATIFAQQTLSLLKNGKHCAHLFYTVK